MTYPHDDTRCEQDSVDAAGFRDACRSAARLSDALGLSDTGHTIGEITDMAIARIVQARAGEGALRWIDLQPGIRRRLHEMRGHGSVPAAVDCAACDQDADQLARATLTTADPS